MPQPANGPRRPSIAITPDVSTPTPEAPHAKYEVKSAYADAVTRAGGLPFILPYSEDHSLLEAWLERVSGVLITGGAFDIPPEEYGEQPREGLGPVKRERTRFEREVLKLALARKLPVLGVCGGMQLLNVALGGTLVQDISRERPGAHGHEQKHDRTQPAHPVEVKAGTVLADCLGEGDLMVNSTHHQAVNRLAPGVVVSALSPDGIVEGIEATAYPFAIGVQWHPELLIDTVPPNLGLYRRFIAQAREKPK